MPETADQHRDNNIHIAAHFSFAVAAKRDIQIIAQKSRKRDMPAPPEIDNRHGLIGRGKILRQAQAEHTPQTDRHIRIGRKIEIYLQRIGYCAKPCLDQRDITACLRITENAAGINSNRIRKNDLLEQPDTKDRNADCQIADMRLIAVELEKYLRMMNDRAGNKLREETYKKEIPHKGNRLRPALIGINQIGNLLESEERYADWQYNPDPLNITAQNGIDLIDHKIGVFEIAQKPEIKCYSSNQGRFALLTYRPANSMVEDDTAQKNDEVIEAPVAIEKNRTQIDPDNPALPAAPTQDIKSRKADRQEQKYKNVAVKKHLAVLISQEQQVNYLRMKKIVLTFMILPALLFMQSTVMADAPPLPESKKETLESLQTRLESEKERQERLSQEVNKIKKELARTKDRMIKLASDMRSNEKELQTLEDRIKSLQTEQNEIKTRLESDYGSIARLVLALQRMRRIPPEAMIARPGAPLQTAQSAMLMQSVLPTVHKRAESLRTDLARLRTIGEDLEIDRARVATQAKTLEERHAQMGDLLKKRESLYDSTSKEHKAQQAKVRQIAAQAQSLKDLVQRLDEDRKRQKARELAQRAVLSVPDKPPPAGAARLPVSGVVRTLYGQPDDFGAPSKGITIDGRPGGIVVAPMGGVVRFAGPFKRFGNIVILEHEDGYHSLIAGLARIDTVVSRTVKPGEPVGTLQQGAQDGRSSLYYELRRGGRPVNPSIRFSDLG